MTTESKEQGIKEKIKKITFEITGTGESGLIHASRQDVRTLSKAVNLLIDKMNEIIEVINKS